MESYPCYQDEETKVAFADYTVNYADQPPNSWFIVFRQVVQDSILRQHAIFRPAISGVTVKVSASRLLSYMFKTFPYIFIIFFLYMQWDVREFYPLSLYQNMKM